MAISRKLERKQSSQDLILALLNRMGVCLGQEVPLGTGELGQCPVGQGCEPGAPVLCLRADVAGCERHIVLCDLESGGQGWGASQVPSDELLEMTCEQGEGFFLVPLKAVSDHGGLLAYSNAQGPWESRWNWASSRYHNFMTRMMNSCSNTRPQDPVGPPGTCRAAVGFSVS